MHLRFDNWSDAAVRPVYQVGEYPQKIATKAEPLGPLPAGRFVGVAVDGANEVWALGTPGLVRLSEERVSFLPLPQGLSLDAVRRFLVSHKGLEPPTIQVLCDDPAGVWELRRDLTGDERDVEDSSVEFEALEWTYEPGLPCDKDITAGDLNLSELEREGRAAVLLELAGNGWLVVLDGRLVAVSNDGFVEPFPADTVLPPVQNLTRAVATVDGGWWFASPNGVCHLRDGEWEYFAGKRWLNSNVVNDIAVDRDGRLWAATDEGLCCIEYRLMGLEEKAEHFETITQARHLRDGFCCAIHLCEPGSFDGYKFYAADNDGLWTSLYVAAESFRYAVTGDEGARELAKRSALAMCRLEQVTPIRGLVARAMVPKGSDVIKSGGEWHDSEDGQWEWKGDTSSDELDGHYFAYSVYYDLAADEEGKRIVAATVENITDYLIENGYFLIDVDGEPTTWGFFAPQWLNVTREDQRGLNSMEILSYLLTAYHICGHDRYYKHYVHLAERHHYAINVINQKILWPNEVNFSDDELAFFAYYPLLTYEEEPHRRQMYLLSLERQWRAVRRQRCPLWNAIYGALTGKFCDVDEIVRSLAELPLELVDWQMLNSHRADVDIDERYGRHGELQSREIVPYDERADFRWNHNPYRLDGGGRGLCEYDGAHYLLPYWLARYHGLISADTRSSIR